MTDVGQHAMVRPMPVIMRIFDIAGIQTMPGDPRGMYVVDCDVDAYDGRGYVTTTDDPAEARQFADAAEAIVFYQRQSTVRPIREDGQPNRPLMVYTIEVDQA